MTNIFISDVTNHHKTSLRADAQSHAALDPELAGSFRFFSLGTRAFNIIANFCNENRGFTRMLATVSARFNPVAAYYKNPHKAFEMAANGDAENVFEGMAPLDYVRKGGVWEHIIPYGGPSPKLAPPIARRSRRTVAPVCSRRERDTQPPEPARLTASYAAPPRPAAPAHPRAP